MQGSKNYRFPKDALVTQKGLKAFILARYVSAPQKENFFLTPPCFPLHVNKASHWHQLLQLTL